MHGQSIKVIEFGPNPKADAEHPNEVSLTREDAMEMVYALYGEDITMQVVQEDSDPQKGKILLDLVVVLPTFLDTELTHPVKSRPEYHTLTKELIGETHRSSFIGNAHTYFEHR